MRERVAVLVCWFVLQAVRKEELLVLVVLRCFERHREVMLSRCFPHVFMLSCPT